VSLRHDNNFEPLPGWMSRKPGAAPGPEVLESEPARGTKPSVMPLARRLLEYEDIDGGSMRPYWACAAILLGLTSAAAQTFTAREIFWGAGREAPAKAPAASAAKRKVVRPVAATAQPQSIEAESSRDRAAASSAGSERTPERSDTQYVLAKAATAKPLGMRYSILKRDASGDYAEVDQDTRFQTGDRIRVLVESNDTGYLYVVQQGTSGRWQTLFPNEEVGGGSNRIDRGQIHTLPAPGAVFTMRPPAGTERLFIILSREPETDMEKLIYSLEDRTRPETPQTGRPMMAQNFIPDGMVQRIRAQARDLLIEKVDESKPAPVAEVRQPSVPVRPGEKAVYVVNAAGGASARVVADIELHHE
jgi:hypothetical protein